MVTNKKESSIQPCKSKTRGKNESANKNILYIRFFILNPVYKKLDPPKPKINYQLLIWRPSSSSTVKKEAQCSNFSTALMRTAIFFSPHCLCASLAAPLRPGSN